MGEPARKPGFREVYSLGDDSDTAAVTTVVIPLYNYQHTIVSALQSVADQTVRALSLIVVDDASTDQSMETCKKWMLGQGRRFEKMRLVAHEKNAGLSASRNTGFGLAQTPFCFSLDADNVLYPRCIARCEEAMSDAQAAFAYPALEKFGQDRGLLNTQNWNRSRLARGNYIDAMALIRKHAWQKIGGYRHLQHGWEDFDLWCSFAEAGWHGVRVPEVLARYRVHHGSMLQATTNRTRILRKTAKEMKRRHPWLTLQH